VAGFSSQCYAKIDLTLKRGSVKLPTSVVALGTALFTSCASALSLGGSLGGAVLGRPLDVRFQIQPDVDQVDRALCPTAEVVQGDGSSGVMHSTVAVQSASGRAGQLLLVRVRTMDAIREPIVTVQVSVGCTGMVRRSYTFLADLPESAAATFQNPLARVRPLALETSSGSMEGQQKFLLPEQVSSSPPVVKKPAKVRKNWPTMAAAASPEVEPKTATVAASTQVVAPTSKSDVVPASGPQSPSDRLVMEPVGALPETTSTSATAAVPKSEGQPGATEAQALPLVMSERQEKEWLQLQTEIAALRANLQEMRASNAQLQNQLNQQQTQSQGFFTTAVLGLLALALAGALWFWTRVRRAASRKEQDSFFALSENSEQPSTAWASAATTTLPSSLLSEQDDEQDVATLKKRSLKTLPDTEDVVLTLPDDHSETLGVAAEAQTLASAQTEASRSVVNPEVISDLQQQADFFISVGENDQAIGLLKQHIAENEATSPLAYLELLRLYQSLGQVEEFKQLRDQFQQHFNAWVPEFASFSQTGRSLFGYVDVLARIEAQWNSQDVLAELARCLFEPDSSTPAFDLNAYEELMLLYAIAQTTPPHARGLPLPRTRTTPQENEISDAAPLVDETNKKGMTLSLSPDLASTSSPVPIPAPPSEPEPQPASLSMDDFSWVPPSPDLQPPAVAQDGAIPIEPESAIEPLPELAPGLVIVPASTPVPEPEAPVRRILMDGEEFDLDFNLPTGLEQELMALAAPPAVSPPVKAAVDFADFDIDPVRGKPRGFV